MNAPRDATKAAEPQQRYRRYWTPVARLGDLVEPYEDAGLKLHFNGPHVGWHTNRDLYGGRGFHMRPGAISMEEASERDDLYRPSAYELLAANIRSVRDSGAALLNDPEVAHLTGTHIRVYNHDTGPEFKNGSGRVGAHEYHDLVVFPDQENNAVIVDSIPEKLRSDECHDFRVSIAGAETLKRLRIVLPDATISPQQS